VLDAVGELYELCDLASFPERAVAVAARVVRADVTAYNEIRVSTGEVTVCIDPPGSLVFPDSLEIFSSLVGEHPLITYHERTRDGTALRIADFMSQRELRATALYQDFYRHVGVDQQLAFTLPSAPSVVIGIAMSRLGVPFSERDKSLANLMRPHFARAFANAQTFTRLSEAAAAIGSDVPDLIGRLEARPGADDIAPVLGKRPEPLGASLLTDRQTQIVALVAEGLTDKEIAGQLGTSVRTVQKHLQHVYRRLGATTRAGAVRKSRIAAGAP
jgi:DNA-binding CsgD family transcriptional regulator/GAF domain-containing protein